jgi:hypothetical protein
MGDRISMVSYGKLTELTRHDRNISANSYDALTALYEAGMCDVLREVAILKSLQEPEEKRGVNTKQYVDAQKKLVDSQIKLHDTLSEEQQDLFREMDTDHSLLNAIESDEFFIKGFIAGYRFLKETQRSFGGSMHDEY